MPDAPPITSTLFISFNILKYLRNYSEVKMQTTSASMAWLFLQENEQVQYLQKIALRAENKRVQRLVATSTHIIFCVCNFLSPLRRQFSGL